MGPFARFSACFERIWDQTRRLLGEGLEQVPKTLKKSSVDFARIATCQPHSWISRQAICLQTDIYRQASRQFPRMPRGTKFHAEMQSLWLAL
jgi:hypothetical protein